MRPVATTNGTEALQNSSGGRRVLAGIWAHLLRLESYCIGTESGLTGKDCFFFPVDSGVGLDVSKLSWECWCFVGACHWLCVYAEGERK